MIHTGDLAVEEGATLLDAWRNPCVESNDEGSWRGGAPVIGRRFQLGNGLGKAGKRECCERFSGSFALIRITSLDQCQPTCRNLLRIALAGCSPAIEKLIVGADPK